jgi:hypothetical protein
LSIRSLGKAVKFIPGRGLILAPSRRIHMSIAVSDPMTFAAAEALAAGRGGVTAVARVTGPTLSRH